MLLGPSWAASCSLKLNDWKTGFLVALGRVVGLAVVGLVVVPLVVIATSFRCSLKS